MALPFQALFLAVLIQILWGANPAAVKFGLLAFPPFWSAFIRFVIAILCMLAWARFRRQPLWPERGEWPSLLWLAAIFFVQIILMNFGYGRTTGTMGAILIATHPLFAALFVRLMLPDERLSLVRITGLVVAFLGVAVVLTDDLDFSRVDLIGLGNWIVLASALLLGFRIAFGAKLVRRIDPVRVVVWQMVLSLPIFLAGAVATETILWDQIDWRPIAGLVYQGAVIAGLCYTISYYLIQRYSPSAVVGFGFISPISGVLISAGLLGEQLSWAIAAGTAAVGVGLVLVNRQT